jgi:hypothetical protein
MIMTVVTGDGKLHAAAMGDLRWSEISMQPADRFRSGLSPEPGQTIRIVEVPDSYHDMIAEPSTLMAKLDGLLRQRGLL